MFAVVYTAREIKLIFLLPTNSFPQSYSWNEQRGNNCDNYIYFPRSFLNTFHFTSLAYWQSHDFKYVLNYDVNYDDTMWSTAMFTATDGLRLKELNSPLQVVSHGYKPNLSNAILNRRPSHKHFPTLPGCLALNLPPKLKMTLEVIRETISYFCPITLHNNSFVVLS